MPRPSPASYRDGMRSFWVIAGAILVGVLGFLVFRSLAAAIPFAVVGGLGGWAFTRSSPQHDSDARR